MTTYGELNDAFARAYNRIVGAVGKESFQMQVLSKFPLVLSTQSVKEIAYTFGFDDTLLIPPANKRTRAQQAIANTQHIGLMLRQGHAAQGGAQLQHGVAPPQVMASPVPPSAPAPAPVPVPVPVTPGQQVIYQVQHPQTPVPNRRRLPPGTPLALTFEAAAPGTPNPFATIGNPAGAGTPLVSQADGPAQAAENPANGDGQVASAQASGAAAPAALVSNTGASGLPGVSAAAPSPDQAVAIMGDANAAAEPPATNLQVEAVTQSENGPVQNDSRLLCVICQSHMDHGDGQALEALPCGHSFHSYCLREWRRVAQIEDLHKCPLHPQSTTQIRRQDAMDDFELVDEEESDPVPAPPVAVAASAPELL